TPRCRLSPMCPSTRLSRPRRSFTRPFRSLIRRFWRRRCCRPVLTGPIYVEDAAPGDALEVRVRSLELRVPYGVNNTGPGSGVLPDLVGVPMPRIIKTDPQRKIALLPGGIELPLSPFLGVMGVAPPPNLIIVSSGPPGSWGGNLDLRQLTVGATLYLPIFNDG